MLTRTAAVTAVHTVIYRPPAEGWKYSSGFINEDMLREHMLPAGPEAIVAMCGPPPMIKFACIPNLEKLGFTEAQLITF